MKKISLSFMIFLMSGLMTATWAQVDVTFQVDMSEQTVSPDGVSVAGDFQDDVIGESYTDWTPGEIFLTEGDPGIYSVTVQLPEGTYYFKYVNGDAWGEDETVTGGCAVGGNRELVVAGPDPIVLEAVCYGSCTVCAPPEAEVTFRVNMADQTVSGDGVHIAGSFQDPQWQPGDTPMTLEYDAVYSYTTMLPVGEYFEYKFINGNAWGQDEGVPGGCNQNGNRFLTVPEDGISLDPVCFGSCVNCAAPEFEVTFQVDMNNETVSPDGVHIAGSFQDPQWQPGDTPMTDAGNGIYTFTASVPVGDFIEYKFINGDEWGEDESVPGECASGFNRFVVVPDYNLILDPVCFGSCGPCEGGTNELFISEYSEGSSNNKYVELYNGTGAPVDLSGYNTHRISNGGDWDENVYPLEGILEDGDVYVIANSSADQYILDLADITSSLTFFNGDDAIGLSKNDGLGGWIIIDVIGTDGPDPGSGWDVAGVSNATAEHTLVRKPDVCGPNADWASSAGTNADDSEWIVYPQDTWDYLGFHNAVCGGTPVASSPVFSVPSGTYFGAFNLEMTCDTPGATIYYTTDGSDPDQGSTEYTGPVNIDMTMDVKAIAIATGFGVSFVTSASYAIETVVEVANIAELRALFPSEDYIKVTGEVILTYQQSFRNQKFIQDATAGVLIDDSPGTIQTEYEIYDGITGIIGTISEFGNMLQFVPAQDPGPATSAGNVIVPEVITLNEMNTNFEEYESELVEILEVTFDDAGETFFNGNEYPISDASKANAVFRTTFFNVDYINTTIPGGLVNLTGICNSRFEGDFITSRNLEDIEVPPFVAVVSPNGGEQVESGTSFEITWESNLEDGTLVDVYLYENDGKAEELLAEDLLIETGMFTWNVTQPFGDNYKVKVMVDDPALEDMSNDFFSIVPPIDVKITEIMYNSPEAGSDTLEFVELYNNGEGVLNLMDWEFTQGFNFTFPEHILNPGEFVVVCVDAEAFLNTFGMEVYEWDSGGLSNGGEDIELTDNAGIVRAYVDYDDGGDWPFYPDGYGPSLTFCDPSLDNEDPLNWSSSTKLAAVNADGNGIYATPMAGCNEDQVLPMFYSWGWTAISSNLVPADPALEEMFAPAGDLVILLNNQGIFWPGFNVNTLGDWDPNSGYKVKFDGSTYFVFSGTPVESKVYAYEPGTVFVPVLSDGPVSVESLIVPLGDDVEFMFDINSGSVYWPGGSIVPGVPGALETLEPGYGYLTKFNASGEIDFGMVPPKAEPQQAIAFENTTNWNNVMATGDQHIVSVSETALNDLEAGDFVGVFNSNEICVGMIQYNGEEGALPLIVYGDDMTTEAVDGMVAGENLTIRIYRHGEEIDAAAVYNSSIKNHDGLFAQNGLSMIDAFKLGATGIGDQSQAYSIYPNPGNGQFNIDVTGDFDVNVTNAQGQLIYEGMISGNSVINLTGQPEGIYFIRLTGESSSMIEKVIVK